MSKVQRERATPHKSTSIQPLYLLNSDAMYIDSNNTYYNICKSMNCVVPNEVSAATAKAVIFICNITNS